MPHCEPGVKATVYYSFNKQERVYVTDKTPIDILTYPSRVNASPNFNPVGFGIRFYSPNNRAWLEYLVRDYIIYESPNFDFGDDYEGISTWNCNSFDFNRNPNGSLNGTGIATRTLEILPNLKCPQPLAQNRCSIEIRHNNIIIFQDQGECPINFEIICGEECPPNHLKCSTYGYPGYCCIPCNTVCQGLYGVAKNLV